jgi:drug/metabolite transporter (DMT)-like permease
VTDIARENRIGVLLMIASMALFIFNDALVKHVGETMSVAQLIFIRGIFASLLIGGVLLITGAWRQWRATLEPIVILRGILDAGGTFLYQLGLQHLPLANITAINLAMPLILTVMAVLILREAVGWRRWAAVIVGFIGVLFVVQPAAAGFSWFAVIALSATILQSGRDLLTRRIDRSIPSLLITMTTAVIVTMIAGAFDAVEGWKPVPVEQLAYLLVAAAFLSSGYWLIIECMRHGELSVVAPFRYVAIVWALILGYLVWGDVPNLLANAGIVLLVGSGIYILHRERLRGRSAVVTDGVSEPAAR